MNLTEFIASAIQQLKQASIDNPQLDARLLICHALKCSRADLLSHSQRVLAVEEMMSVQSLLDRRVQREPVARIIGNREFWGLEFGLNEATLEPRPDSETLVEAVLSSFLRRNGELRILDLGTGTGCLLLSLLHELPQANGIGLDIHPRAIEQASQNATKLGLGNRAQFIVSDWLAKIEKQKFDIIVSNPPYIPAIDIPTLMPEVRDFDPILALDGGKGGLAPYRLLIPQLTKYLNPQGIVAFEVGIGQVQEVADMLRLNNYENIQIHQDLGGIERCLTGKKSSVI